MLACLPPRLRTAVVSAAGAFLLVAAGCQRAATSAADSWFPLDAGLSWTYRVSVRDDHGEVEDAAPLVLASLGEQSMPDGQKAFLRRSADGMDYWLRADAEGVRRIASRKLTEAEPQPDEAARFVLKAPYVVGTQWQASTSPYVLQRPQEAPRQLRHRHQSVPMTYTIEAIDDAVETPAGAFRPCLRVRGQASLRLYADAVSGWSDVPLITTEWYCRGPGLVKLIREEPGRGALLTGGSTSLELLSGPPGAR